MAIAKMRLVNIIGEFDVLEETLSKFIGTYDFHPVDSKRFVDTVQGVRTISNSNPYSTLLAEIMEIEKKYDLHLSNYGVERQTHSFDEMKQFLEESREAFRADTTQIITMEEEIKSNQITVKQIKNLERLDISLDDLFTTKYTALRIGKLPKDSVEKLKYYTSKPIVLLRFNEEENYVWCMYLTPNDSKVEIDNMMSALFFERVRIPSFVHGKPATARIDLEKKIEEDTLKLKDLKTHLKEVHSSFFEKLSALKSELMYLDTLYGYKKHVVSLGDKFLISGFVEKVNVVAFEERFKDIPKLEIEVRPCKSDKRLTPPTKLKNNRIFKPFEMFVDMYGIPGYRDADPTVFVGITYMLLFGIMFGDVGQGLVMAILGFLLSKFKKMQLGKIMTRIGISSMIFGFFYGSVFGNETLLDPLFESFNLTFLPIHVMDSNVTMNLLIATVMIGSVIIFCSITMNTIMKLKQHKYADALCSHNGLSGLLFYGTILIGILGKLLGKFNLFHPVLIILLIVIPILVIFMKEPLDRLIERKKVFPDGIGGFFIEGFFELFEIILSYVTNTLSFLRVGGFVLSHAGMMLVVHTLMQMNPGASIPISIIGNLFVMGLEGLIVGIQVLRLEFYEMFSRYHEGNGIQFKSIN